MKKIIFILAICLLISEFSYSQLTFFVNGATGNDTIKDAGTSPKIPFKTISQALKVAPEKSEIIIEGKNGDKSITYKEYLLIKRLETKIIGKNYPILNGDIKDSKEKIKNGITVNADFIKISGLIIKNYNQKSENNFGFNASAGIYAIDDFQFTEISDCTIDSCGNGIQLNNPQLCKINNCKISNSKSFNTSNFKDGGIGICIYGTAQNLQAIEIGVNEKNIIDNNDTYGIFYGNIESESFGESTVVKNNVISNTKSGAGIYISGTKSNVHIIENLLIANLIGIKITGDNADLWIDNNSLIKTTSDIEMQADEKYFGGLLKAFWFENKNSCDKTTYAVLNQDESEIYTNNNIKLIVNNKKIAEELSKGKLKIIEKNKAE